MAADSDTDTTAMIPDAEALLSDRRLAAFAPLLYLAHAELEMGETERARLAEVIRAEPSLPEDVRDTLVAWFHPSDPPSVPELQALALAIAEAAESGVEPTSVADLGATLFPPPAEAETATRALIFELESALGLSGDEAARSLSADGPPPLIDELEEVSPSFSVADMTARLDGDHADVRARYRAYLARGASRGAYALRWKAYRARVGSWLKDIAELGLGKLITVSDEDRRAARTQFMVAFETLAHGDLSLLVKVGVQWGLFAGAVQALGTEAQREKYLPGAATLQIKGCFAMSELGHGSNVAELETVARWDADRGVLVLHTPYERARKEWIGGAAKDATHSVVFAQLIVDGQRHGVHAMVVPLRSDSGELLAGIRAEDCGLKMGLNGVDNGRLWFDHVEVPISELLGRYAAIDASGGYTSPIASPTRRFFTMLSALVGGRMAVGAAAVSVAEKALRIAVAYGSRRRQFGRPGELERRLLDYPTHRRRLMPRLATTYGLRFANAHLRRRFESATEEESREIETLAAALKVYSTRFAIDAVQQCREACGGQGYLAVNAFPQLRADVDVFATFEGDNTVLMQLVSKGLLTAYQKKFAESRVFAVLREVADLASTAVAEKNPVAVRRTDTEHLRSRDFQLAAMEYRQSSLTRSVATRIQRRLASGSPPSEAFDSVQNHLLALSNAFVERVIVEAFNDEVDATADPTLRAALDRLCDLYAMSRIEADLAWFLENDYLHVSKARAVRKLVDQLCDEARDDALSYVEAFAIPDAALSAPIATEGIDPSAAQRELEP